MAKRPGLPAGGHPLHNFTSAKQSHGSYLEAGWPAVVARPPTGGRGVDFWDAEL